MPIYDFECASCGHKAEVMRKVSAPSVDICPACGKEAFAKQVSAPSFQLSGTGWYATDFKGGQKPSAKTAEPTAESASETSSAPASCGTGCACH